MGRYWHTVLVLGQRLIKIVARRVDVCETLLHTRWTQFKCGAHGRRLCCGTPSRTSLSQWNTRRTMSPLDDKRFWTPPPLSRTHVRRSGANGGGETQQRSSDERTLCPRLCACYNRLVDISSNWHFTAVRRIRDSVPKMKKSENTKQTNKNERKQWKKRKKVFFV